MIGRIKLIGVMLAIFGVGFLAAGAYTFYRTSQGANALQAFSAAQNVKLNYNDEGQLVDRGKVEGAQAIMALLTDDWGYAVDRGELNPNDPLVNTASEYMYQMATIAYHTLNAKTNVTLDKDVEFNGTTYKAGTYEFVNDGRYWTGFNRQHPIEGPAREKIWTGTAHALIAELGVGSVTANTLQVGFGLAGIIAGLGLVLLLTGIGLVWAVRPAEQVARETALAPVPTTI